MSKDRMPAVLPLNAAQVIEHLPSMVLMVDRDLVVHSATAACGDLARRPAADLLGRRCGEAFRCLRAEGEPGCGGHPECQICVTRALVIAAIDVGASDSDLLVNVDAGEPLTLELALSRVQAGASTLAVLNVKDVTEREARERERESERERELQKMSESVERADAASREKSAFLAHISHEIRTPMNAILGYTQLLARDESLRGQQRAYLGSIIRSGDHLLQLVNDVLAMSRIEAGRAKVVARPLDWWGLLDDVEKMLGERAQSKGLRLEFVRGRTVPRNIVCDEPKLRQILVNLIGNAIKFTEAGAVTVRSGSNCASDGVFWHEVDVSDTGVGIPPEDLERIFRPFEQVQAAKAREGTGLGLAISAQYAQVLGGELTAGSRLGKGSKFALRFPAEVATSAGPSDYPSSRLRSNKLFKLSSSCAGTRALVADDLEGNREVLVRMLEALGFEVSDAVDGLEAIERFRTFRPAVVLMDRWMPGLDGFSAMRGIRRVVGGRRSKILIVSASAMQEDREEALAVGADGFIPKPVVDGQLVAELARVAGLEFDERPAICTLVPSGRRSPVPLSQALGEPVPTVWAEQMLQAARACNLDRLMELIPELGESRQELQQGLRRTLDRFDYDAVIQLLERWKAGG